MNTSNPYKNIVRDEEEERQRQLDEKVAAQSHGHYSDKHIDGVTKDFCNWVVDLGGDEDNIEEDTVGDLFAIGHEAKPPLAVPLNVIQLIDVPRELTQEARVAREMAIANKKKKTRGKRGKKNKDIVEEATKLVRKTEVVAKGKNNAIQAAVLNDMQSNSKPDVNYVSPNTLKKAMSNLEKKQWLCAGINTSKTTREKLRYGAWYLEPKKWTKMKPGELLQCTQNVEYMSDIKRQSNKFDEELAPMHVTKVFMDYVYKTGKRKPDFFNHIEQIQEKINREESAKAQEVERIKQKLLNRKYKPLPTKAIMNTVAISKPQTAIPPRTRQSIKQNVTFITS